MCCQLKGGGTEIYMIIGTCGFTGTGTSAASDYLKEYRTVCAIDNIEVIIAHAPDGLEDLDYQLNQHCAKYTSSVVALERFRRHVYNYFVRSTRDKKKQQEILLLTDQFLKSIVQISWRGMGAIDYQLYSNSNKYFNMPIYKLRKKIARVLPKKVRASVYPLHKMEFSIKPECFEERAKEFTHALIELLGGDYSKTIVLDQPFSGNNPLAGMKYFDDAKAIVVDRDPRDLYVQAKYFSQVAGEGYSIPTSNVQAFTEYFKRLRSTSFFLDNSNDYSEVLRIRLEDLIYEYDRTSELIDLFCGLNRTDKDRRFFDPNMSIANTQLFKRYPVPSEDIEYIENNLSEYLFPFEKYPDVIIMGEPFADRSPLNQD